MLQARDWYSDGSLYVVDLPLACCALETQSAAHGRPVVDTSVIPEGAPVVLTLSGTITTPVVPAIEEVAAQLPSPTVVAFGSCACAGGPYWDSYPVVKGTEHLMPVDYFIAGCPPPPEALDEVFEKVRRG